MTRPSDLEAKFLIGAALMSKLSTTVRQWKPDFLGYAGKGLAIAEGSPTGGIQNGHPSTRA